MRNLGLSRVPLKLNFRAPRGAAAMADDSAWASVSSPARFRRERPAGSIIHTDPLTTPDMSPFSSILSRVTMPRSMRESMTMVANVSPSKGSWDSDSGMKPSFHTMLALSVVRVLNGWWLGLAVGAALAAVLHFAVKYLASPDGRKSAL